MALDKFMRWMTMGMVLGFLALMPVTTALGSTQDATAHSQTKQTQSSQVTAESSESQLPDEPSDHELVFQEYRAWSTPIWCALLDDKQAMVRVMASLVAERALFPEDPLSCDGLPKALVTADIRAQALKDGWDNPAVVALVYNFDCHRQLDDTACDHAALQQRLVELAPENAYSHLLPLSEREVGAKQLTPFSAIEKQQLARAASASHYHEYAYRGVYDTFRAFEREQANVDPLVFSSKAISSIPPEFLARVDYGLTESTFTVFAVLVASANASYSAISQGCKAASEIDDEATVNDCLAVAELMADSGLSYLTQSVGRGIWYRLMYPEFSGYQLEALDPNRWKKTRHALVQGCEMQRGLPGMDQLPGHMPMSHLALFLEDFQNLGERIANQNASAREYARYPEAFALDPNRCEDILTLDEDTQRALVEQWEDNRFADNESVLATAAAALDRQSMEK